MIVGDCRDVIPELIESGTQFDSIVTDPPYGLRMYGLDWDDGVVFSVDLWRIFHAALKPGGYVAALASPRLYHRVATAAEGAGLTILPMMYWQHDNGLPKPVNVSELMDRDNLTERRIVGLRKLSGVAANNARYGEQTRRTRYRVIYERNVSREAQRWAGWFYGNNTLRPTLEPVLIAQKPAERGRVIDNIRRHGTGAMNVDAIRGEGWPGPILRHPKHVGGTHPTQKPVSLMEDLCRLLTPPGGHILDPFAGSGSTGEAAARNGFRCTMIERDPTFGIPSQQAAE